MNNEERRTEDRTRTVILSASPSPHIRHEDTTRSIMTDVIIALLPALVWGVICFGLRALAVVLLSVASSVAFEFAYQKIRKRRVTVGDFSAAVCGLLFGLTLPAAVPYFVPIVGAFLAIVVFKNLLGEIEKNFLNPALAARVVLSIFPGVMTTYTEPFRRLGIFASGEKIADTLSSATPLASLAEGNLPDIAWVDLITGKCGGAIGEVSSVLLIIGGLYLLIRRVITWHIPVSFIGSVLLFTALFPQNDDVVAFVFSEVFAGGLILAAFFMATDYATSPVTNVGRLVFGALCGILTVLIRYFIGIPEGVALAVLIMNLPVCYIDRFTRPRTFGSPKRSLI
ncbi:MAG: RnfABCDGE type electron transport complex subunit D [Ruminococcaceae bacterium]|nr:RnfABCDGE type electron transport complex subunit D [Oscillospiraceae bacterium]